MESRFLLRCLGRRLVKQEFKYGANQVLVPEFTQDYAYVFDQDKILIGQSGDGARTVYLDGQAPDEHLGEVNATVAKSYITDHLGSVLNTNAAGAPREFGPFGESFGAKPGFSAISEPVLYGFAGRQLEPETGLYYNRARMYSPALGRFISPDPLWGLVEETRICTGMWMVSENPNRLLIQISTSTRKIHR